MSGAYAVVWWGLLLSVTGCASTSLFHADFDADPAGALPNMSPPGAPAGDRIWIGSLAEGLGPPHPVSVIRDGAISGHSLRYSNIKIPTAGRAVRFYSIELSGYRPRYWATWVGRLEGASEETSALEFRFGNATIGYAAFKIQSGKFLVPRTRHPADTSPPSPIDTFDPVVGDVVPGRDHAVVLTIDNAAGDFTIDISQHSGLILHDGPRWLDARPPPILFGAPPPERYFYIQLEFLGERHSDASYVIDAVTIHREDPAR